MLALFQKKFRFGLIASMVFLFTFVIGTTVFASADGGHGHSAAITFLFIAIILIMAKISSLVEKIGQPSVLGELLIGVLMGNLALIGINIFEPIKTDSVIAFLAELGVVILLFQIGLESNIQKMKKVGTRAFLVACVGAIVPFILGAYILGPIILPNMDSNAYLFLGAALTATSVGITARVFQDLKKLHIPEAQIVLGAAVIDDVLGLIVLAIVSAIATLGAVSLGMIGWITAKAILFLVGSIVLGQLLAPRVGKFLSKIQTGSGMKFTLAMSFGLTCAFLAQKIGLAPIVGAFAAGLILDPVHFSHFKEPEIVDDVRKSLNGVEEKTKQKVLEAIHPHAEKHVKDLIQPVGMMFVPIFFVMTGMNVKLETLFNPTIIFSALIITAIAFVGKIVAGLVAGKCNKLLVGVGMIPRGEVGLIFAMIGKSLGVLNEEIFSIIVIMVILTTLLTPPILTMILKKQK